MSALDCDDGIDEAEWDRLMHDFDRCALDAISADIAGLDTPPVPEPAAPPTDPWLARRLASFGASEVAALLVALGRRHAEDFPAWVRAQAKPIRTRAGIVPRVIARKAGLAAEERMPDVARTGTEREPEVWRAFAAKLRGRDVRGADLLDPDSLSYVPATLPQGWLPLRDHVEPRLSATPDAWAHDVLGRQWAVELKCSTKAVLSVPPHYALQLQTQMAVMGAECGLLVVGQQWAAGWLDDGPIAVWAVERDDAVIAEIREAAAEGWRRVEALRGGACG